MHWKKIAMLSAMLTAVLFAGLFMGPAYRWGEIELKRRAEAPAPVVATTDETRAILTAVLAHHVYEGVPLRPPAQGDPPREDSPRTLIVSDRSLCLYRKTPRVGCGDGDALVLYSELDSVAPLKLRTELVMANRQTQPLSLDGIPGTRVVAQADIDRVLQQPGWWAAFYRKVGKSAGMVRIARPVVSPDGARALILVDHSCDGLCGSVTLFALDHRNAQWHVSETFQLAVR